MLRYIELKSGYSDDGPAWIGQVRMSRSGRTVYFNGKTFRRIPGGGGGGNYCDVETGDEYWISGVKKNGQDRHWAGNGKIIIEASAVADYLETVGKSRLADAQFIVSNATNPGTSAMLREIKTPS